jgi:RNA polymerase sigma factor (sigma-70 family)
MDAERLFLDNLPIIDRIVAATCRRNRMTAEEGEDFASSIRLKLIANDYAVLRAWAGKSSLAGYLTAVAQRALLDQRNHQWGKWRPCMEARRLGPLAVRLDTLLNRDGLSLEEACAQVAPDDREEARRLADRLPARANRRRAEAEESLSLPASGTPHSPETLLLAQEREDALGRLLQALGEAVDRLPDEDRLLVRLRLERGVTLASAAPALGYDVKQLYRRWEALLRQLRASLEGRGYDARQVTWALDEPASDETAVPRPSIGVGQSPR